MISHKYKCIFVEVPKTGSTSIRSILGEPEKLHLDILEILYEIEKALVPYDFINKKPMVLDSAARVKLVRQRFDEYFKFGFVRNPWDRTVSLYMRKEGICLSKLISFDQFVDWIHYSSDTSIHPSKHINQLDWLTDKNGKVLVDFIGRFERLEQDWEFVCQKLGLAPLPLPYLNSSGPDKRHYTDFYTPRTREIIANKFARDIEFFGYEFLK